jgi:hypothetical protein
VAARATNDLGLMDVMLFSCVCALDRATPTLCTQATMRGVT